MSVAFSASIQVVLASGYNLSFWIGLRAKLRQHELNWWVRVTTSHGFIHESCIDLVHCHSERLGMVVGKSELSHTEALQLVLVGQKVVNLVIEVVTDRRDVEKLHVVFE